MARDGVRAGAALSSPDGMIAGAEGSAIDALRAGQAEEQCLFYVGISTPAAAYSSMRRPRRPTATTGRFRHSLTALAGI